MLTASTKTITTQELEDLLQDLNDELTAWWYEAKAIRGWLDWASLSNEIV